MELTEYQKKLFADHVKSVEYIKIGRKTTVALITVKNGFEIVGSSACVNPDDFNEIIGQHYALVDALDKLDGFVGFAKQGIPF
jgi:hypothetical protein